jgi:phenylacetate-CoA ligase
VYTRFCSNVLFPLHEKLKRHDSVKLLRELETTQWWERPRIEALQLERLRAFLDRIDGTVPYYTRLFREARFEPAQLQDVTDLRVLPFLTKSAIRANTDQLKSTATKRLIRYNTGGSSGEPLVFFMGPGRVDHDVAAKWRATRWWGVDIGDVEVVLWGSPVELGKQDRLRAIRDRVFRSHLLPAFQMSDERMDRYLDTVLRLRPKMLFGYASALALLARHARGRGRDMRGAAVQVAFATGETLYPEQRREIEEVFGAPVANGYGARDAGFIAHECAEHTLHLSSEHVIVELVGPSGEPVAPGDMGEIIVTHMATEDFPFVRYRTGDMARMSTASCRCGRALPAFAEVLGRSTDFIRTADGNVMHALALIYEVRDKPGVRAFKFVQNEDLSLELLVAAGPEFDAAVEDSVRRGLEKRMGAATSLTLRRVDDIPPEKSGKYRYVVSRATG